VGRGQKDYKGALLLWKKVDAGAVTGDEGHGRKRGDGMDMKRLKKRGRPWGLIKRETELSKG